MYEVLQPIAIDRLGIGLSASGAVQFGKSKPQSVWQLVRLTAKPLRFT
jgi:hypothetical protein